MDLKKHLPAILILGVMILVPALLMARPDALAPPEDSPPPTVEPDPLPGLLEQCRQDAAAGKTEAMRSMALLYELGVGREADLDQARAWYEKAAAAGDGFSLFALGAMYAEGRGAAPDEALALDYYTRAAQAGDIPAMEQLAFLYDTGRGAQRDTQAAAAWLREAEQARARAEEAQMAAWGIDLDTADEQERFCYDKENEAMEHLYGAPRSVEKAVDCYEQAAQAGSVRSMLSLGRLYFYGDRVPEDLVRARHWFLRAAEAGSAEAMEHLSRLYSEEDFAQSEELTRFWTARAAGCGQDSACFSLYLDYHYGDLSQEEDSRDRERALFWALRYTEPGYGFGLYELGELCAIDWGGWTPDYEAALYWYRRAADKEDSSAMEALAELYEKGLGTAPDAQQAEKWRTRAEMLRDGRGW